MAYTAGDTILDDEYNAFINNSSSPFGINHIGGTGSAQYGLGESAVAAVSPGNTITASQWNALFSAMDTVASHTATSITSTTSKSAGDTIAVIAAITSDLASLASAVAAGSVNTTALTTSGDLTTAVSGSTWGGSFTSEMSVTFASANTMRHFFNAGGKIRFIPTVTGSGLAGDGAGPGADAAWTNLYAGVGNLDIKAHASTRSGNTETVTTNGLALGFHDLTTSYQTILKLTDDTYPYQSNTVEIQAKLDAAVGTAVTMTVKCISINGTIIPVYDSNNLEGSDTQSYRNGEHTHKIRSVDVTTASGLTTGIAPSSASTITAVSV